MHVLLTGATGFLGSHVARALVASGHRVRALARVTSKRDILADVPETEWVTGDLVDPRAVEEAVRGCDAVIHTAAIVGFTPRVAARQHEVNVEGTRRLLDAARAAGVRRFVHTSSIAAIGRGREGAVADEETRYDWPPGLGYNESKRDSERLVRRATGIETVCVNPALVFGPGEVYRRTLPLFRLVKWGLMPLVPPGGTTLCDVRDVAAAHVAALTHGEPGARYILGGPQVTFRELATTIAEVTRGARPIAVVPAGLLRAAAMPVAGLGRLGLRLPLSAGNIAYLGHFGYYASARAEAALGYHTRPAAETLGDAARWYTSQRLL
jgi:dihydroflavonol-4-reductase